MTWDHDKACYDKHGNCDAISHLPRLALTADLVREVDACVQNDGWTGDRRFAREHSSGCAL